MARRTRRLVVEYVSSVDDAGWDAFVSEVSASVEQVACDYAAAQVDDEYEVSVTAEPSFFRWVNDSEGSNGAVAVATTAVWTVNPDTGDLVFGDKTMAHNAVRCALRSEDPSSGFNYLTGPAFAALVALVRDAT